MDSVLADIDIEDPTANVDSDEEMADVAPRAVQKQEKQKEEKQKKKKKEKAEIGKGKASRARSKRSGSTVKSMETGNERKRKK